MVPWPFCGTDATALARGLAGYDAFAIDCASDLRSGGALGLPRAVKVAPVRRVRLGFWR